MDELNVFYKKVQTYLMKKNQECEGLQFLTVRATSESISHIDEVCETMLNLFESYSIPTKEKSLVNNEKCALSYLYLLLNTKFKNQERLAEDIVSGHLVDMCPPISPYLFIQILWKLEYEKVLIQSFYYMPFDLFTEVLAVMTKCIEELPFPKSMNIIYDTISIAYTKLVRLNEVGVQSQNFEESIKDYENNLQEFLLLLTNPEIIPLATSSSLKKSERYGIMLKKLVSTVHNCLEHKFQIISTSGDLKKLYNVTFGNETYEKCEESRMKTTVATLNGHLIELLLIKFKVIDCNIFLNWAEIDDEDNSMISLQRSIGIECYYFLEFIKSNEELSQNTHLIECLQVFSSKPDSNESSFVLSLQELCCAISEGKKELMKELLCRHKEWDRSILDFVFINRSLVGKKDCFNLLQYLTFVLEQSTDEEFKNLSYTLVMKILSLQVIPDIYEIVMMYLTKHDGKNYLESPHTEEAFNDFITRNSNLQTSTNLRIVLLFLLKNLRLILTIILKITIGHQDYGGTMIPANDTLLLSPFMGIRGDNNEILLTSILRTICIGDAQWDGRKFMKFIIVLLEHSVIEEDNLMNNVFIPYLEKDTVNLTNVNYVLYSIRKLQAQFTKNTNFKNLIMALAKKMSFLRKDKYNSKYASNETFNQITKVLTYFLETKGHRISDSTKREIFDQVQAVIEPIDKLHFTPLWLLMRRSSSAISIIEDYERRCFNVINRLKEDPTTPEKLRDYLSNLSLLREDILRYLITWSTDEDYCRLSKEVIDVYYYGFGWKNDFEGYDYFSRLMIEACCLSLEYPIIGGTDLFPSLFKSFTNFAKKFLRECPQNRRKVYESLMKKLRQLERIICQTHYADLYNSCFTNLDRVTQDDYNNSMELVNNCSRFSDQCLNFEWDYNDMYKELPMRSHDPKISNFYVTHEIISACMKVPATEAYECIKRMNELFVSS
ncbi:uncharacterized protein LOC143357985 [Halictus rubicundus]|uniref:uncharacterized protein LOC143357985 n=1 Tax=Halictus rubicundus TaxID=77578 RepID=UPI00403701DD